LAADTPDAVLSDEKRLQLLIQAVGEYAIYMLDADGYVATWNPGVERVKGYAAAEIMGRPFSTFFTAEDQAAGKPAQLLDMARRNGRYEAEDWRVRKDGTRFWALATINAIRGPDGRLIGFANVTRDMTERMRTQEALRASEHRFRMLVDSVVDYAIFMLDARGIVTNWNTGAQRIKGYTAADIVGQHFSKFYTEPDRQRGMPQRGLETAARDGRYEAEGWRVRKDGTQFWASVVIDPVRDDNGELIGFAKVTRDITERRLAQETLEQTRAALMQAQKMEAIGQLTGGIAHDFNNLLTVVINNLDLIQKHAGDAARIQRLAQAAQRAADRGAKLTQQLLAFGRRQPLRPETADLNHLIAGFEALLRRACGESIGLDVKLAAGLHPVSIDTAQFESVLLNLVFNARDAMARGGVLRVVTGAAEVAAGDKLALRGLAPGSYMTAAVEDGGSGMPPEVIEHAFEPFFTTKEPGKGSGLGLSQVHGFVSQSGGYVLIDSVPGDGTTITLFLPVATGVASAAAGDTSQRRLGTVLVVEDDPDVLQSTVEMVRGLGYDVLTAGDGYDALSVLQRNLPIDILFSDVVMPRGMNGIELAREARRLRPELRVILSSGYASGILTSDHGLTPDFSFIGKPYRWPDLAEKLRGGRVH
jgi:PAS domain S-box-containing protein